MRRSDRFMLQRQLPLAGRGVAQHIRHDMDVAGLRPLGLLRGKPAQKRREFHLTTIGAHECGPLQAWLQRDLHRQVGAVKFTGHAKAKHGPDLSGRDARGLLRHEHRHRVEAGT